MTNLIQSLYRQVCEVVLFEDEDKLTYRELWELGEVLATLESEER